MEEILKQLLTYSFKDINFDFNQLTPEEKSIFKNKETFDQFITKYVK